MTLVGRHRGACVGGRVARPAPPQGSATAAARPTLLLAAAGIALVGLLLEAFFRSARLQSLQAYDAWAFWVPKAKAIYFFGGLDEQVFTTRRARRTRRSLPILDAAAFHAMGGVDTITFHLQFWFLVLGAVAAIAGLPPSARSRVAPLAVAPARARRPAVRRAPADTAGGRPRRRPLRRRRRYCSRSGSATARPGDSSRPRCSSRARRSRSARACSSRRRRSRVAFVASLAWRTPGRGRLAARRARRARGGRSLAPLVPEPFDRRRGADRRRRRRLASTGWSTRSASRSTCSSTPPCGRSSRSSRSSRWRGRRVWGDRRVAAFLGALLGARLRRWSLGDVLVRRHPDHGRRVGQPDRALHRSDRPPRRRRDAAPARRRSGAAEGASRDAGRRRDSSRRRSSSCRCSPIPLVVAADGARFPSRDDCVRIAAEGETGRARSRLRAARHARGGRRAARAGPRRRVRRRRGARGRVRPLEGPLRRDHVVRAGARARAPRRAAPGSRPGSRSSRPADAGIVAEPEPTRTMTRP